MWSVGPTMRWPIFEGGRIRAYIEARNAQEEQTLLIYQKTVLSALAEVVWSPKEKKNYADFRARLPWLLARFDRLGVNYRQPLRGD